MYDVICVCLGINAEVVVFAIVDAADDVAAAVCIFDAGAAVADVVAVVAAVAAVAAAVAVGGAASVEVVFVAVVAVSVVKIQLLVYAVGSPAYVHVTDPFISPMSFFVAFISSLMFLSVHQKTWRCVSLNSRITLHHIF